MAANASVSRASSTKFAPPSKQRWTWQSINPGVRVRPAASISAAALASLGARACGPTHSMRPSRTRTPALRRSERPSNSVAFAK